MFKFKYSCTIDTYWTQVLLYPFYIHLKVQVIVILPFLGYTRFADDVRLMLGKSPMVFFKITWCFISPIVLFVSMGSVKLFNSALDFKLLNRKKSL